MSRSLTITLPDDVYARIVDAARTQDRDPGDVAAELLTKARALVEPDRRSVGEETGTRSIREFFGTLDGPGGSSDNEAIDADLAREYAGLEHEDA